MHFTLQWARYYMLGQAWVTSRTLTSLLRYWDFIFMLVIDYSNFKQGYDALRLVHFRKIILEEYPEYTCEGSFIH